MGYCGGGYGGYNASYHRLPRLNGYADALRILEKTEPIRGRSPVLIPLGERRYADKFSIRMAGGESADIECLHYTTPILTFHKDGRITISRNSRSYWSASDREFVRCLLRNYVKDVNLRNGRAAVHFHDGQTHPLDTTMHLTIQEGKAVVQTETFVWRLDRAKANATRANYKEFFQYASGMLKLRTIQPENDTFGGPYLISEAQEVFGTALDFVRTVEHNNCYGEVVHALAKMYDKPTMVNTKEYTFDYTTRLYTLVKEEDRRRPFEWWSLMTGRFIELIKAGSEEDRAERFATAFALLLLNTHKLGGDSLYRGIMGAKFINVPNSVERMVQEKWLPERVYITVALVTKMLNEIVFKYHSEDVLTKTKHDGQARLPATRYDLWATR